MLLIAAAMGEELGIALDLCSGRSKERIGGVTLYRGRRAGNSFLLVKTGVGPGRAAEKLERLLAALKPRFILVIGYAGALDPSLRLGDLVIIEHASALEKVPAGKGLEDARLAGGWDLAGGEALRRAADSGGLAVSCGALITSPCVIGNPEQKRFLFDKFAAATIDMETAALARTARSAAIPLGCVRVITDDASDRLLAPLSYTPSANQFSQAVKVMAAGDWLHRYSRWRENTAAARRSLSRFLACYLDKEQP